MIIEVDSFKKEIKNYDPEKSEDFHEESGKLADKAFITELKTKKYTSVILMSGGVASGKTEFCRTYIKNKKCIVYDVTLKNFKGYTVKLDKIERYDKSIKNIKIILIIPLKIEDSFSVFLERERKMSNYTFFESHIRSKETVSKILKETKTKVEIYLSVYNKDTKKVVYRKLGLKMGRKKTAESLSLISEDLNELSKKHGFDFYDK